MINGYVNIPSELEALGTFFIERTVPGIYKKMQDIITLNKPIVGHFNLAPTQPIDSIFPPIAYYFGEDIMLGFTFAETVLTMRINSADQVIILP